MSDWKVYTNKEKVCNIPDTELVKILFECLEEQEQIIKGKNSTIKSLESMHKISDSVIKNINVVSFKDGEFILKIKNATRYEMEIYDKDQKIKELCEQIDEMRKGYVSLTLGEKDQEIARLKKFKEFILGKTETSTGKCLCNIYDFVPLECNGDKE